MDDRIMYAICFRRRVNGAKRILEQVEYYDHNMQLQPLFNEDNFDWCKALQLTEEQARKVIESKGNGYWGKPIRRHDND